jgi:hypothetical protein
VSSPGRTDIPLSNLWRAGPQFQVSCLLSWGYAPVTTACEAPHESPQARRVKQQAPGAAPRGSALPNAATSPLAMPCFRPALVSDPRPALKLVIVHRDTAAAGGKDEHAGGDQFVTDVRCRAGVSGSGCDAGGFGEDVIVTIRHLAEFGY